MPDAQNSAGTIDAQTRSQEQTVIAEVRNAVQAVETSRQRVLSAQKRVENAEIQLEGERKLFEAGRSTTFLLFQRENTLAKHETPRFAPKPITIKRFPICRKRLRPLSEQIILMIESPLED